MLIYCDQNFLSSKHNRIKLIQIFKKLIDGKEIFNKILLVLGKNLENVHEQELNKKNSIKVLEVNSDENISS